MASNVANNWKLGLFVVVAVLSTGGAIAWAALENFEDRETFLAYTYFDEPVNGLQVGSVLQHRGIEIGEVESIRAAPDRKLIQVTCEIDKMKLVSAGLKTKEELEQRWEVPANLRVRLERNLLTGQAYVQTDYYDPETHPIPDFYQPGFVTESPTVHSIKSAQATIDQVFETLPRTLDRVDRIVEKFEIELSGMDLKKLVADADELLETANSKIGAIDVPVLQADFLQLLENGKATLADFDSFIKDLRSEEGALYELLTKSKDLLGQIESELERAEVATATAQVGSAAAALETTLDSARAVLPELIRTLKDAQRLFETLERDPGSIIHGRTPPADPRTKR